MSEYLEQRLVLVSGRGLHARAATRFASTAAGFDAQIEVERAGATGDGKSVMAVLMLVAADGDEITLRTRGPDSTAALAALTTLVTDELGVAAPRGPAVTRH
jgi:phosphocarrier protein HPr